MHAHVQCTRSRVRRCPCVQGNGRGALVLVTSSCVLLSASIPVRRGDLALFCSCCVSQFVSLTVAILAKTIIKEFISNCHSSNRSSSTHIELIYLKRGSRFLQRPISTELFGLSLALVWFSQWFQVNE